MTERRTARGKTFDLGGNKRKLVLGGQLVHYRDGDEWKDVDTTIVHERGEWKCETLPYRFTLHKDGIGFDFIDREGGVVSNRLVEVGGQPFEKAPKPEVSGDTITFAEVAPDLDIILKVLPGQVKTLRILKSERAPRSFVWNVSADESGSKFIVDRLAGWDNYGATKRQDRRDLHLLLEKNGERYTETWTGQTKIRHRKTRVPSLSDEVTYPVEIDPTINRGINQDDYDGHEKVSPGPSHHWYYTYTYDNIYLGYSAYTYAAYHPGWRFTGDSIPLGATIDEALLTLNVTGCRFGSYGGGKIYGVDTADFNPGFSDGGNLPTNVAKTSVFTTIPRPTTTGVIQYDVTGVIAEINVGIGAADIGLFALTYETTNRITYFEDFHAAGTDDAKLDITYTIAGGDDLMPQICL